MKHLFILLYFTPLLTFGGPVGLSQNNLSFYWGQTFRLGDKNYNSFELMNEQFYRACIYDYFFGSGIRFDDFNSGNYALSLKYFHKFTHRPDLLFTPYLVVSPVLFEFDKNYGCNLKPEIGFRFNTDEYFSTRGFISFCLNASYGYDIPILNKDSFKTKRNDLSVKVAVSFNFFHILYQRNKKKNKAPEEKL